MQHMGYRLCLNTGKSEAADAVSWLAPRLEGEALVLPNSESVPSGEWVAFEVLFDDGSVFFEGMGRCEETRDAETGPAVVLKMLQLDTRNEMMLERLNLAKQSIAEGRPSTGQIELPDAPPSADSTKAEAATAKAAEAEPPTVQAKANVAPKVPSPSFAPAAIRKTSVAHSTPSGFPPPLKPRHKPSAPGTFAAPKPSSPGTLAAPKAAAANPSVAPSKSSSGHIPAPDPSTTPSGPPRPRIPTPTPPASRKPRRPMPATPKFPGSTHNPSGTPPAGEVTDVQINIPTPSGRPAPLLEPKETRADKSEKITIDAVAPSATKVIDLGDVPVGVREMLAEALPELREAGIAADLESAHRQAVKVGLAALMAFVRQKHTS